jgi:hypothetical protein
MRFTSITGAIAFVGIVAASPHGHARACRKVHGSPDAAHSQHDVAGYGVHVGSKPGPIEATGVSFSSMSRSVHNGAGYVQVSILK